MICSMCCAGHGILIFDAPQVEPLQLNPYYSYHSMKKNASQNGVSRCVIWKQININLIIKQQNSCYHCVYKC